MIDITELEQYFPEPDKPVKEGKYTFTVSLTQESEEDTFVINLKIKQDDTKEDHLIKFRIGIGKDKKTDSKVHETNKPHFEIDIYKREKNSFKATAYFTFNEVSDEELMKYAKGTVYIISEIIDLFFDNHKLSKEHVEELVYRKEIQKELSKFETFLIDALYECYKKSDLVIRDGNQKITIKTPHNLDKYLNVPDLKPLYLPLLHKIEKPDNKQHP